MKTQGPWLEVTGVSSTVCPHGADLMKGPHVLQGQTPETRTEEF